MIQYEGMKAEENKSANFGHLPVGAYVAKILKTEIDGTAPNQALILGLDVADGEFENFYMNKFLAAKAAGSKYGEVKYKGTYRLRIPNVNNKEDAYPETTLKRFNDMIFRFQQSNPGFTWTGDETQLIGLLVGINMQEDAYNGNTFTRVGMLANVQDVREGKVKPMKPRKRQGTATPSMTMPAGEVDQPSGFTPVETVELPF